MTSLLSNSIYKVENSRPVSCQYNLIQIFDEKYYRDLSGGILEAFGKLFYRDLKVYMYPYKDEESGEFITSDNLKVHPRMKELYKFFKNNGKLKDIQNFDPEILHIFSRKVLQMIKEDEDGWEEMLPEGARARGPRIRLA